MSGRSKVTTTGVLQHYQQWNQQVNHVIRQSIASKRFASKVNLRHARSAGSWLTVLAVPVLGHLLPVTGTWWANDSFNYSNSASPSITPLSQQVLPELWLYCCFRPSIRPHQNLEKLNLITISSQRTLFYYDNKVTVTAVCSNCEISVISWSNWDSSVVLFSATVTAVSRCSLQLWQQCHTIPNCDSHCYIMLQLYELTDTLCSRRTHSHTLSNLLVKISQIWQVLSPWAGLGKMQEGRWNLSHDDQLHLTGSSLEEVCTLGFAMRQDGVIQLSMTCLMERLLIILLPFAPPVTLSLLQICSLAAVTF